MTPATLKAELAPARSLMDRVLRGGDSIAPEFPLVFREGFPGKVVALGDESGVHSACTVLLRELVCEHASLSVGLIGSVSTAPEFRRQGLATKLLEQAEQNVASEGAVVSFLWADDPRFYFARGYRPVGSEEDFMITAEIAALLPTVDGVREAVAADAGAIHALYTSQTSRVVRTEVETAALLECPGMHALVREEDGAVVAYACLGRGQDLDGTVHEWGGDAMSVLGLVREHVLEREIAGTGEPTFLISPTSAEELCERLRALGAVPSRGVLGLAKIVDREAAATLLGDLLGLEAEVSFDASAPVAEQVRLVTSTEQAHLNDDTLLVLLFSAQGEREDTLAFGEHFGVDVSKLPLEPFIWGLDSI